MAEISLVAGKQAAAPHSDEEFQRAASLYGAAEALRAPINSVIDLVDHPRYEQLVADVQTHLGGDIFTAMWAEGAALTLDQAVDYTLEGIEG